MFTLCPIRGLIWPAGRKVNIAGPKALDAKKSVGNSVSSRVM